MTIAEDAETLEDLKEDLAPSLTTEEVVIPVLENVVETLVLVVEEAVVMIKEEEVVVVHLSLIHI